MSKSDPNLDEFQSDDEGLEPDSGGEIGKTSDESPIESDAADAADAELEGDDSSEPDDATEDSEDEPVKKSRFKMSVYETMLLLSLIFVTVATVLLVLELKQDFGGYPWEYPWRTTDV